MAIGDFFSGLGQRVGKGLTAVGGYDPMEQVSSEEAARRRQEGLAALQRSLGKSSAILSGDPRRIALAEEQTQRAEQKKALRQFALDNPQYADMIKLQELGLDPRLAAGTTKTGSVERFSIFSNKAGRVIGSVLKTDAEGIAAVQADPDKQIVPLSAPSTSKSAVSDPLRTITMGGKVIKNVRDSDLTPEEIQKINKAGQVIQPLGFTEKFESSKDVDFAPIKSKYLATQNIIVKTSELSQKFVDDPSSALAVGGAAQFIDGVIQNLDAGADLLSSAKDKKAYQYMQKTSTSLQGKDFGDAIKQASQASGVAESRIRDLAYLFAAARGQEGRGLSDKDFENALKIVSGGVGAEGRGAVLKDVSNSLREEFYRDINFDIATSENEAYVNKLKGLPELPYYVDPFAQQTPTTQTTNGIPRVRIKL
jgi:hypothetical protein